MTLPNEQRRYMHGETEWYMQVMVAHAGCGSNARDESNACAMLGRADVPHNVPYEETGSDHANLPGRDALVGGLVGRFAATERLSADVKHRLETVERIGGILVVHPVV